MSEKTKELRDAKSAEDALFEVYNTLSFFIAVANNLGKGAFNGDNVAEGLGEVLRASLESARGKVDAVSGWINEYRVMNAGIDE